MSNYEPTVLLCSPSDKEHLEARNSAEQLCYIEYLVARLGVSEIRESHVLELQRLAVTDIYPCAGSYRSATADVRIGGSEHTLPEPALVPSLVKEALTWINNPKRKVMERAAYALWRFNWIHPFRGGNARASRAIAYFIICAGTGKMLPGNVTIPTIIKRQRTEYIRALKEVDRSELSNHENPDFSPMIKLLDLALTEQLTRAISSKS